MSDRRGAVAVLVDQPSPGATDPRLRSLLRTLVAVRLSYYAEGAARDEAVEQLRRM